MDITEQYIKMCVKATEIQESHKVVAWDYYYCSKEGGKYVMVISGYTTDGGYYGPGVNPGGYNDLEGHDLLCWLPRQDQLQEMVDPYKNDRPERFQDETWNILDGFHNFVTHNDYQGSDFWTMEQWWLAFVMKEKFNKTWNGEEWR